MNAETWQQVKRVFAGAMELPSGERAAYLDRECGGNTAVRAEAESLLRAARDGDSLPGRSASLIDAEEAILHAALKQQYEVLRPLGRGGMGSVYLARERALERFVAIKVLRPELAEAPAMRERFRREARVAAQLTHPGIISLHTFGDVGGLWYFVMDYVRGVSLAEKLRLQGRVPWRDAHRILTELADALDSAHRNGVIHRDIKPANILLEEDSGRTMLADFGIAKTLDAADSLTMPGAVVGTPSFMSPEQALGSAVDARTDIYSLGAVGYTMLTGREPFTESTPHEMIARKLASDPAPIEKLAPSVPPELTAIVRRCLERNPDDRWPNARALRDALRRASGDTPIEVPEPLRDLPTFGPYALLWLLFWLAAALLMTRAAPDRLLLVLLAVLVPIGLVLHVWNIGTHGLTKTEIFRIACWPPEWWAMWWPSALRRPNDLYPRLPLAARLVRGIFSLLFVAAPLSVMLRAWFTSGGGVLPGWLYPAQVAIVTSAAVTLLAGIAWAMSRRLTASETVRVLIGATTPSAAWASPRLAPLLSTRDGGVRVPDPHSATDHRRAIDDLLPRLPDAVTPIGGDVQSRSQRLVAAIEECDAEIAALSKLASDAELEHLREQLASLQGPAAMSHAGGTASQELKALVERQLAVMQQVRVQSELLAQKRSRHFDLLRALWMQLSLVHDARGDDQSVTQPLVSRLRALLLEIDTSLTATASRP